MADGDRVVGIVGSGSRAQAIAAACRSAGWQVHSGDIAAVTTAGPRLVIEAVAGGAAGKERILGDLDAAMATDAVLAIDAAAGLVETWAGASQHPERVVGLHLVDAVPRSGVVEVVATGRSSSVALEVTIGFVASLGWTAVLCADAPGLIVDRVGRPFLVEAVRLLEAGQGSVAGIDAALEAAGYACGPLRLIDRIGLAVDLATDAALFEAFDGAARFRPPSLQQDLVDEGRLGRTHGRGFYRYASAGSATPDLHIASTGWLSDEELVERLELATINEAYRAVEERVAAPPDVDLAMRLGLGFPRGPFERVDQLGLRHIVARLHELHGGTQGRSGDQYEVAPALWQMATV